MRLVHSPASQLIDLRSDTVTQPTAAMRQAMVSAVVGDDCYGEDPTVNRLQHMVAELMHTEAALFVPSGTMANQIAIRLHTHHGDAVLAGADAHIYKSEAGAASAISGVQIQMIGHGGGVTEADMEQAQEAASSGNAAPITLLSLENTHTASGGTIFPYESMQRITAMAKRYGWKIHLDGARLLNAAHASKTPAHQWAALCDTVSICLSKGLGAPVGSLICGSAATILQARRFRKMLGGGLRQSGILAAAGIYALEHHMERLLEDHVHARLFADGLKALGARVINDPPPTNIVLFAVTDKDHFVSASQSRGLRVQAVGKNTVRAVMHLDVTHDDVVQALQIVKQCGVAGLENT